MSHLLKEKRSQEELEEYLLDKKSDYLLEQYAQARISFEEDVRKGRYSKHAENVRASLKLTILRRMLGYEQSELERFEEEHSPKTSDFI